MFYVTLPDGTIRVFVGGVPVSVDDELPIQYADEEIPPAPKPSPEIPAECHNARLIDPEKAWAAVVAACKGAQ